MLSDIQVNASPNNVEECHRIVKPGSKKKKTRKKNSPFFDQETLEETPVEQKKLQNLDEENYGFSKNTKVFINKNLTLINENIAFNGRNLKRSRLFHACFTIDGIVCIKKIRE